MHIKINYYEIFNLVMTTIDSITITARVKSDLMAQSVEVESLILLWVEF
jgi:hypothetical protein